MMARKLTGLAVLAAGAAAATVACTSPTAAAEGGMGLWPKGFVGFMSGYVPPQSGLYMSDIYYHFNGSANAEVRDGLVETGIDVGLNADFLQAIYVTDWKILGGQYAFGAASGWAWMDLTATLSTRLGTLGISASNNSLTDTFLTPMILGWHDGNFSWNVGLSVYAPTGPYSNDALNIGRNVWGLLPQFAITYFDPATGWDVSGNFIYVGQTTNNATDYQTGGTFNLDWAIGKRFGEGLQWEAGVAGNVVDQVAGDSGSGAKLGAFEEFSFGLGPAISYGTKFSNVPVTFSAKWEHDVDTTNTFKGDVVTVSATASF